MRAQRLLALAALLAAPGCTLVVEGVEPPVCSSNADCQILNQLEGIGDAACERYQCGFETARCELGIRDMDRDGLIAAECADRAPEREVDCDERFANGVETCNGLDDDCDGVIDERSVVDGEPRSTLPGVMPAPLVTIPTAGSPRIGLGAGANELAIAHVVDEGASLTIASGLMASPAAPMSYGRAADLASLTNSALEPGCHARSATGAIGPGSCNFRDTDVGLSAANLFVATVSTAGCAAGQLRVGYGARAAGPSQVIERGPARRSSVFLGVDVEPTATGGLPCTGASRGGGVAGAARPSVSSPEGMGGQALVAFLAAPVSRAECGGEPVDVEVLGLHVQTDTFGGEHGWVTGSNEGAPQRVGSTTGGGRPSVGDLAGSGYLVAFGDDTELRLVLVDLLPRPPAFNRDDAPESRAGLETPPLVITELGSFTTDGSVDDVQIASGSIRERGVEVGLAWREGCGSGAEAIRFRQLVIGGTPASIDLDRSFDAVTLSEASAMGAPSLAYAYSGLRTEGARGGWYVAWPEGPEASRSIQAARVSEADGAPLDPPFALHPPGDQRRAAPALYRLAEEQIGYAFFAPDAEMAGYRGGTLSCVPPASP